MEEKYFSSSDFDSIGNFCLVHPKSLSSWWFRLSGLSPLVSNVVSHWTWGKGEGQESYPVVHYPFLLNFPIRGVCAGLFEATYQVTTIQRTLSNLIQWHHGVLLYSAMTLISCDCVISLIFIIISIRRVHYSSNRSTTIVSLSLIYVVILEKYGKNIHRRLGPPCCVALKRYGTVVFCSQIFAFNSGIP